LLLIFAGCAPRVISPAPKRPQGIYHVVRPGENLYRIGKAYDISYQELARVNGVTDASRLRAGQKIFIPGATRQLPVEIITPTEPSLHAAGPTEPVSTDGFIWPVSGAVNSPFGPRNETFHDGIDIAAPEGTPIHAIERGEVIYSDQLRGYGYIILLRHASGFVSVYAHNQSNLVREGQWVERGEVIARVGSTGRVSGPHLHFEIRRYNAAEDPLRYLPCCLPAANSTTPKG
jgi:murein DD-endopeptidase MepM/ murein hydrolase activator NlpD